MNPTALVLAGYAVAGAIAMGPVAESHAQGASSAAAPAAQPAAADPRSAKGDPAAGREKTQMCEGCHGIPNWKTAFPIVYRVPMLGGQHPAYIVRALQAYKSGERSHPSMRAIAGSLSDKDMADLAAYYGSTATATAAAGK